MRIVRGTLVESLSGELEGEGEYMWRRGNSFVQFDTGYAQQGLHQIGSRGYGEFVTDNPLVQGVGHLRRSV